MRWLLLCALLFACGERSHLDDDDFGEDGGTRLDSGPRPDAGMIPDMVLTRIVIDGDTLVISAGSNLMTPDDRPLDGETIRLLGVDTPEIAHDPEPAECYGPEAKVFTEMEIGGRTIELTYDIENGVRDDFGRLLAYVSRNGQVHNERLIETGHARAFRQFDHRERSRYIALESEARDRNLGLWNCP
jgi:micrococcal nuclease